MRIPPDRAELVAAPLPGWAAGLAGGLVALHGWLAWLLHATVLRTGNDDALYLLLARSLRHLSYRDSHILGAPVHSQYPPGYPGLLALTGGGLGLDLTWPSLTSAMMSMLALGLIFDLARRVMPLGFAMALLTLLALNGSLVSYGGAIRSETPYMAFTVAAIWGLSVWPGSRKAIVFGAAMALLAGLTRSIGVTLLAAVGVHWLLERHLRRVMWFGVGCLLTFGAWTAWNFLAPVKYAPRSYAMMAISADPALVDRPWKLLLFRLANFGKTYALSMPANLSVPSLEGQWFDNAAWLVVIFGLGGLGLAAARRRAPLIVVYLLCYLVFLALWPVKLSRFLVPLIPFVLLLMVWGASVLAARWRGRGVVLGFAVLALLAIGGATAALRQRAVEYANCDPAATVMSRECASIDEHSFAELLAYSGTHLPDSAVVVTTKEATFAFVTHRRVVHPDLAHAQFGDDYVAALDSAGVHYFVVSPLASTRLPDVLLPHCRELVLMADFPPRTALLRLGRDPAGAADSRACAVLTRLIADTTWRR